MRLTYLAPRIGVAPLAAIEAEDPLTEDATPLDAASCQVESCAMEPCEADGATAALAEPDGSSDDLIELLFFAYRDFVGDPDRILSRYGFGRAHHRVLHFVDRYPGLTIAELLDILRITKQSLNRVLKDLIERDYIRQKPGTSDRRQRLLFCTPTGAQLAGDLSRIQARRIGRALEALPRAGSADDALAAAQGFLFAMIEPGDRGAVQRLMTRRNRAVA